MEKKTNFFVFTMLWALFFCCAAYGQDRNVSGTVTDADTHAPMAGVTVVVKGSNRGTTTDQKGHYMLTVPDKAVLAFSFIGYADQEVPVGTSLLVDVSLTEATQKIEELVVVGYGVQRKATVTGSLVSVSNEELLRAPVSGVSNALVGLTSGLQALQTSGEFGSDKVDLRVRGIATLNTGGSSPLILVDGVERATYNDIDPTEIESLNILKDASATAVFGVRGANGVILITTRQGKVGKPKVSFSANIAGLQPSILPKTLGSYDYAMLRNEAQRNDGASEDEVFFKAPTLEKFRTGSSPVFYPDVDWLDELIKPLSFQQNYNANISGGSERMRFFVSLTYFNQSGGYHKPEQDLGFKYKHNFDRYNVRMNFDFNLTRDLVLSVKLGNQVTDNVYPNGGAYAAFDKALSTPPMASPGFVDGKLVTLVVGDTSGVPQFNPWAEAGPTSGGSAGTQDRQFSNTLNTNVSLKYNMDWLTKGLSVRAMVAYDSYYKKAAHRQKYFDSYTVIPAENEKGYTMFRNGDSGPYAGMSESISASNKWRKIYAEAAIEYNRSFGDHRVTALFLANLEKLHKPSLETGLPHGYLGLVGRVTYDYRGKYMMEFNAGYNGSENFAPENRFGFFPAVSAGWMVSEENFLKDSKVLSYLKIRGSYGEVGNDQIGGQRYMYLLAPYALGNGGWVKTTFGTPGIDQTTYNIYTEGRLSNEKVQWEVARKWNVGFDMRLLGEMISLSADYFEEKRGNILWTLSTVPEYVAAKLPASNFGKVNNYGYEFEAAFKGHAGKFNYWLKGNFSFARSKIIDQDEVKYKNAYQQRTGHPVGQYFGLVCDGFYNTWDEINDPDRPVSIWEGAGLQPGDLKYRDLDKNGIVDSNDVTSIGYGNWPEITYGFSVGGSWKGLDFSILFQGAGRVSTYFSARSGTYPFAADWGPAYEWNLERWTQERYENGDKISFPRLKLKDIEHNYQKSSFWVQDGSYLRLKNLEIGYTFPKELLQKARISNLRVYISGNNLYTWKNNKYPMDPDAREVWGRVYPPMRVYNIGVNFQF